MADPEESLRAFLQDANEPRDKALIIVLMDINRNMQKTAADLSKNTELTEKIEIQVNAQKDAFVAHLVDEQTLFAQGRGMYKGLTATVALVGILFGAVATMGAYIGNLHVQRIDELIRSDGVQSGRLFTLEEQVRHLQDDRRNR